MSEPLRILLVEDQEADAILIQRELRRQDLTFTVRRVDRDEAMIRALREFAPDLVISDFALPGFSGLEALAILRKERPGVPLIFVSGTVGEEQAVELLKLGATDYVLKDNLARLPVSVSRALREVQLDRERRRAEEQYRAIVEKMEGQFTLARQTEGTGSLPAVAHDLNNILAPISMAVSMLRNGLPDTERERMLGIIEQSARRASEIVREALATGRNRGGERLPLELGRVIKEVFQKLQKTWPETLRVKLTVGDDLWRVTGDAAQLEQVIVDLCINAREAMPGGGTLRLGVGNRTVNAADPALPSEVELGPFVVLEVGDTGKSLSAEIAAGVFDPFAAARGGGEGVGLRLSAVQGIVKRHGGFVRAFSTPGGEGMTFQVSLPATREEAHATAAPETAGRRRGSSECILLVDDEETIRFAAKAVLTKHGYRVLTASEGAAALKVFEARADEIALVLTDLMMPVMDGMALVRALRQGGRSVPIIASSGQNEKTHLAELQAAGISTVLDKPYAADILLRTVGDVLGARAAAS